MNGFKQNQNIFRLYLCQVFIHGAIREPEEKHSNSEERNSSVSLLNIPQLLSQLINLVLTPLREGEVKDLLEVCHIHLAIRILLDELRVVLCHDLHVEQGGVVGNVLEVFGIEPPPSLSVAHFEFCLKNINV